MRDQTLSEAKKEGERIIDQAKKNEEKMRQQLAQEVEEKAVEYGGQIFSLVFSEKINAELNKQFPTRTKGVVEKCSFCAERLAVGQLPACVEASNGKLVFGDLYDPESKVRELIRTNYTIRRKQALGTEPSVYYIV